MIAAIPLRDFSSPKTRLATRLDPGTRGRLTAAVASRVAAACTGAGWEVLVVSSDLQVTSWCRDRDLIRLPDPGGGLDAAAASAVAAIVGTWAIVHGDLPLLTSSDLAGVAEAVDEGATVLAPSRDGGTNLLAGSGDFPFAYGTGSFARHLARASRRSPRILMRTGLAVELDTPADLAAARRHDEGQWLARFLS